MSKSVILALLLSLLVHGLIAVGLVVYLECAPQPDVLVTLDLSSVELSFAEQVEDVAAVVTPPQSARRPDPMPPQDERPPTAKLEKPLPPEVGEIGLPEPREDVRRATEAEREDVRRAAEAPSAPSAPRQARLDAPPKPKRNIRPDYPKGARQRGEQGEVTLEILVNAEGFVEGVNVAVSSGFPELDEAAVRAARAARFSPARAGRDPVASTARLKLRFKLK